MIHTFFVILFSLSATDQVLNLSLNDVKQMALENNRDIKIEMKNFEASRGEITKQEGIFDPIFNISSSYTDAKIPTVSTFIPSGTVNQEIFDIGTNIEGTLPTGTSYDILNFSISRTDTDSTIEDLSPNIFTSLRFSIGQELLKNFGVDVNLTPVIVAKTTSEISYWELEKSISDTLLQVESVYWLFIATIKNLELEKTALDLARDLQNRNEIQVEVGVLPRVAVTEAKSEVAARQVDVIRAENALRAVEDNLKNLLVIPLTQKIIPTEKATTVFKSFDEDEVVKEALQRRPEINQAELDIKNRETLKKFFGNQKLPRFAVEASLELQGLGGDENPNRLSFGGEPEPIPPQFDSPSDAFNTLFGGDFPTWKILGIFSFPLFNRRARGDYIMANADLQRSVIAFKQVVDDVRLDVRSAIREVNNSLRRIEAARVAVELREEVLRNEEERLTVGIGTTREVLEAQRDLVNERTTLIGAVTDYNIALAEIEHARGTILENAGVVVEDYDN